MTINHEILEWHHGFGSGLGRVRLGHGPVVRALWGKRAGLGLA
jgi:hypothetical protein